MIQSVPLGQLLDALYERDPALLADPYPLYARLRAEDPVHRRESTMTFFIITRYADVMAIMHDSRFSADRTDFMAKFMSRHPEPDRTAGLEIRRLLSKMVIFRDPPSHTRLRRLMQPAFTPRMVEAMRDRTQQLVDETLRTIIPAGRVDLVSEFAYPLSSTVKLDLIGVPVEDRDQFQEWCDHIAVFFDGLRDIGQAHRSMQALGEYLRNVIAGRRARPRDDLLSELVMAEADGGRLSEEELFANVLGLTFLGHKAVANLIGNGILALLRHPDQLTLLSQQPNLIGLAVEELLRYDTPDQAGTRIATENCEIGGKWIEAGSPVSLWVGAANRDPARFQHPDKLDITRNDNRHLAFAPGTHHCLGSGVARMVAQVAIGTIVRRLHDLRLATETLEWEDNLSRRGLKALPVSFAAGHECFW